MSDLDLLHAEASLISHGLSRATIDYLQRHRLDALEMSATIGGMAIMHVKFSGLYFDFADPGEGEPAVVVGVLGDDGDEVIDLAAWPVDDPTHIATMFGRVTMLGAATAWNPASFFAGQPLRIFRSAVGWLQSGGNGVVIVDMPRAARELRDVIGSMGRIAGEDAEHGAEIGAAIAALTDLSRIVVPERLRVAA